MQKIKKNWLTIKHKKLWIDSMIGMTWGFIASLVVGTIVGLFGINQSNGFSNMVNSIKAVMSYITPFAIGVGVGYKSNLKPLQILATMIGAGIVAHSLFIPKIINGEIDWTYATIGLDSAFPTTITSGIGFPGDVFGAWIASVLWIYLFRIFIWEFMLDIIFLPLLGATVGFIGSLFITYSTTTILVLIEWVIDHSINKVHWAAILLAPVIGAIMGLALSMPTSSAAIAFALKLNGDAATAAMAATAAQMIAFGVLTYLSTKNWQKSLAVGFGTSMLQMKNFMQKPQILIIPTLMSMFMATLAVWIVPMDFPLVNKMGSSTSGMGTSAFYGPIFTLQENGWNNLFAWVHVLVFQLILPLILTSLLSIWVVQKKRWIKVEDLRI